MATTEQTERPATVAANSESVPSWVRGKVLPATGTPAESVQVLRNKAHKSAVVFARGRTFVAEKPMMGRPRIYEVYYPEDYVIAATECPHCHERIEAPFRRVEVRRRTGSAPMATETAPAEPEPLARTVYEGKNYELIEVEGIGETYAKRLETIGIKTTDDFLAADAARVAAAAEVSPAVVEKWRGMAELMRVKGIGKQFAELLVRSGVASIDDLKQQEAKRLLALVNATQDATGVTIQGAKLNTTRVGQWIREAKKMKRRAA
jgi:predicted flap endonuclease-1-like 5' DNA nuclease